MALTKAPAELLNLDSGITITTADNTDQLTLLSTDADASQGPSMAFYRNSSSPADSDDMGNIFFYGENDNDEKIEYGRIRSIMLDASDGTEDSNIRFWTMNAGTLTDNLTLAGGNVGIGETSPNALLAVGNGNQSHTSVASFAHTTDAYIEVENTTTQNGAGIIFTNAGTKKWTIQKDTSSHGLFVQEATDTTVMAIDQGGWVTMPFQPAFTVRPSSTQSNIATGSDVTVAFGTEIFDQNSDFASNTFTAPVTGRYWLGVTLRIDNIDKDASYYRLQIATSNRTHYPLIKAGSAFGASDPAYVTLQGFCLADMDASDTVTVQIHQVGGTAQADIITESQFQGYLVA